VTPWSRFPLVYEINTRAWLADLGVKYGWAVTLADVPDAEFRRWHDWHFHAIWLMGVWQPSEFSRQRALADPELVASFARALPDWKPEDIASSPYAVADYSVAESLGGDQALAKFRKKLNAYSMKLMLDFVPNHTAVEHPWVTTHPSFYIQIPDRTNGLLEPEACSAIQPGRRLACGRLLRCPPWKDTLQLNLAEAALQRALIDTLLDIARQCDGVRCDTAITALKDIFHHTWGGLANDMETEFWDKAIDEVKRAFPNFLFLAEVYGEFEWRLQQLGFDFTYDKTLYDRLAGREVQAARHHLAADWEFTRRLSRFTENHDWARAPEIFGLNNKAASLLTLSVPGLRILHEGQIEGRRKELPVYVVHRPHEETDHEIETFYGRLFTMLNHAAITSGDCHVLDLSSDTVIGVERRSGDSGHMVCLANLGEANAEIAFSTDALAHIQDYQQLRIVSTELNRSPQFDLLPSGITVRLRGHEGLLLGAAREPPGPGAHLA
jgi:glycosidase